MKSSFFEYSVAMSGLFTARANLNVVSHNIANSAMPGYSRQYALQKASRPMAFGDGRGMYGTGSEVYGVSQIRDVYLDRKYWSQNSILGEFTSKNTQLSSIEGMFNDLNETSMGTSFTAFFQKLQDLTRETPDATYRSNVITAGETLASLVRTNAEALQKQQRDINQEVEGVVQRINSLGTQLASLNKQIAQYEYEGSTANDLRDQRSLLVDELSAYVNVSVEELDYSTADIPYDKRFTVMINGYDFVNHTSAHTLMCVPRDMNTTVATTSGAAIESGVKHNEMDAPGMYDLYFADSGASFNIYSTTLKGTLKGLIDMRDGNNTINTVQGYSTTTYKGIPFYMNKLNTLVRTFAKAMNEGVDTKGQPIPGAVGHVNGYDFYGNTGTNLFFTYGNGQNGQGTGTVNDFTGDPDYLQLNCLNFTVNPRLTDDPYLLACTSDPNRGQSSHDLVFGFIEVGKYTSLFKEGKLIDFIIGTTDHLAIDRMQARNFEESYSDILMATDNQRLSVSGVDINEEIMAMIKYNQLYQACAKLVNVINSIYDTMINRLGVG